MNFSLLHVCYRKKRNGYRSDWGVSLLEFSGPEKGGLVYRALFGLWAAREREYNLSVLWFHFHWYGR